MVDHIKTAKQLLDGVTTFLDRGGYKQNWCEIPVDAVEVIIELADFIKSYHIPTTIDPNSLVRGKVHTFKRTGPTTYDSLEAKCADQIKQMDKQQQVIEKVKAIINNAYLGDVVARQGQLVETILNLLEIIEVDVEGNNQ